MKIKFILCLTLITFLLVSCKSKEDKLNSLNATKQSPALSPTELVKNFDELKGDPVIIEGVVSASCCAKRMVPLIDINEYIYDNGDAINIDLYFKDQELSAVREFNTGMPIKVVGFAEEMKLDKEFIPEIGAKKYDIKITDCIVLK